MIHLPKKFRETSSNSCYFASFSIARVNPPVIKRVVVILSLIRTQTPTKNLSTCRGQFAVICKCSCISPRESSLFSSFVLFSPFLLQQTLSISLESWGRKNRDCDEITEKRSKSGSSRPADRFQLPEIHRSKFNFMIAHPTRGRYYTGCG